MKTALVASCFAFIMSLGISTTPVLAEGAERQSISKKCRYGSYVTSSGKRRCRRAPRGSH